jgi:photosystem II stability/assembly factor-like uncharacterized protein
MNQKNISRAKTQSAQRKSRLVSAVPFFASLRLCAIAFLCFPAAAQDTPPANARDLKPRPAEIAPLAAQSLLLAIARAGDRLVAVGDRGVIVVSGDGRNWEQVAAPVHALLTAVSFADAQHGWAAGHDAAILHTTDGGRSWQLQNFQPQLNKPVLSVLALDAQRAWAVGAYGLFLTTADGGASWTQLEAPALLEEGLHLNALIRLNSGAYFIAGETGLLAVSSDGAAWTRLKLPYEGSLFGALPRGEQGAMVFGLRGNVFVSDDVRSNRWTRVDTQTFQSMFAGAYLPGGEAALVGADGEILLIATNGAVRKARGPADERSAGSGTLAGVVPADNGLLAVGELGVSRLAMSAP